MTDSGEFSWDAFSHGQIASKVWLCEELGRHSQPQANLAILGSWWNVLGFMLKVRGHQGLITGYDRDPAAVAQAEKITDCWSLTGTVKNVLADVCTTDLGTHDVVINTSCEHMSDQWYRHVRPGTLLCLQSSDREISDHPWLVTNPARSLRSFLGRYPLSSTLFTGCLPITYDSWGYQRFMIVGIK